MQSRLGAYGDQSFAAFCRIGEVIKIELTEDHGNAIRLGGSDRLAWLFDNEGLPLLESLRALLDGELEPTKLSPSEREAAEKFRSYCEHIAAFTYEKGFTAEQVDMANQRLTRVADVVKRLEGGLPVSAEEVVDALDRNAVGKVEPRDGTPSERVFYEASLKVERRIILNVQVGNLSAHLFRAFAAKLLEVSRQGTSAIAQASLSAEDPVVRFRQNMLGRLDAFHHYQVVAAMNEAAARRNDPLVAELTAERDRGLLFLVGENRLTLSLHAALEDRIGEFVAQLADPEVANGRVVVMRTGKGRQDGRVSDIGSLLHAMDTGAAHARGDGSAAKLNPSKTPPARTMGPLKRAELEELLWNWFVVEKLPGEEVDRIHDAWRKRVKDQQFVNMLRRQFDPANRVALGAAWWEERQQGEPLYEVLPIVEVDLVKMWLTIDPLVNPPRPRPWCPDGLLGPWRLAAIRNDRRERWWEAPSACHWTLLRDGRLETVGDKRHEGWSWAAHRSGWHLDLYLAPNGWTSLPEIRPIDYLDEQTMDVFMSDLDPCHLLWRRPT